MAISYLFTRSDFSPGISIADQETRKHLYGSKSIYRRWTITVSCRTLFTDLLVWNQELTVTSLRKVNGGISLIGHGGILDQIMVWLIDRDDLH